jgi:hypothetical protein
MRPGWDATRPDSSACLLPRQPDHGAFSPVVGSAVLLAGPHVHRHGLASADIAGGRNGACVLIGACAMRPARVKAVVAWVSLFTAKRSPAAALS